MQWLKSRPSANSDARLVPADASCLITVKMAVNTTSAMSMRAMYFPNSFFSGISRFLSRSRAPVTIKKHGTAHIREAHTANAVVTCPSVSVSA